MSTSGQARPVTPARPNAVAIQMRRAQGWSQLRLAQEFQDLARGRLKRLNLPVPKDRATIVKQISRVERGETLDPGEMYEQLWCAALETTPAVLFGRLDVPVAGDGRQLFAVTSHKFIPVFLGAAELDGGGLALAPAAGQWMDCQHAPLAYPGACATSAGLYLWPWGVAVVHLREDLELTSLGQLAVWRRQTYPLSRGWVDRQLRALTGDQAVASTYVLSAYWLGRPVWAGEQLDTAVRLLAMPSVLLDREDVDADDDALLCGAELVERSLIRDGSVDRGDLVDFGARGVSVGYASWSGVAYHPVAPNRALAVSELVSCELLTQGIWCYTAQILRQVEDGADPQVPAEYGWRFLRAIRSRLTAPRAVETGQHSSMRDAVLLTSRLAQQLDAAIEALR